MEQETAISVCRLCSLNDSGWTAGTLKARNKLCDKLLRNAWAGGDAGSDLPRGQTVCGNAGALAPVILYSVPRQTAYA